MMPVYVETLLKSILSFIALIAVCRVIGKRVDIVLPVVFGALAAFLAVDRNVRVIDGLIALGTWGLLTVLLGWIVIKSKPAQNLINGQATPLIQGGNIVGKNLQKLRMPVGDLLALLREKDAFKLAEVEFAALESDGQISVMKKADSQPVTPKTAGIAVQNEPEPKVVIEDGVVNYNGLLQDGYVEGWILSEAKKQGATSDDEVFLAQLDNSNNLYVDLKNDVLKKTPNDPTTKSKLLLLASLKKIQSDLESFAMQTENQAARTSYTESAEQLKRLISETSPFLKM
ncbi:DUF421 domain-containing protein [Alicyclobacillus dauci]|uniref:DUF421 domain-containing protein n=1 Tax=Alicyclobacillus dauci TaxID=1475485 RepID=A0ABY6YYI2_9BACL|nr:DUF421 domain-containing protein [Alicyclobacillus dauci]WAH35328.1 DUF421 domain-containing protein [Alicyclobacillus dauci]